MQYEGSRFAAVHRLGGSVYWTCVLSALCVLAACESQPATETGALAVELALQNAEGIDEVQWRITGGGMLPMEGVIDTSAPGATASVEVFGIPSGEGYLVSLTADSSDGETSCEGSANFDITEGATTDVHVMLRCKTGSDAGAVRVGSSFELCATLAKVVVSPLQTSIGDAIALSAQAEDAEQDPIAFLWTATGGDVANPTSPQTSFTCVDVGENEVSVSVSDDGFVHCDDSWTVSVTCVDGGGGTGGTGGTGGSGFPAAPVLADGPNMSDVFDPLGGDRALLLQDDLLMSTRAEKDSDKTPTLFGVPTENGEPQTAFEQTLSGSSPELAMQTVSARLFNTAQDYIVNIRSTKDTTITLEALEWTKSDSTFSFTKKFTQEITNPENVNQIFVVVDDFNLDGLDDIVFTPNVSEQVLVATAMDVNKPGELQIIQVPGARKGSFEGSRGTGDLDGDGMIEVIDLGTCQQSTSTGPSTNNCVLGWMTLCPTTVPNTACADAPEGWSFVIPETSEVTISAPSGRSYSKVPFALGVGDFLNSGRDQVALGISTVDGQLGTDDNIITGDNLYVSVDLYEFSESFEPTRQGDKQIWQLTNRFDSGVFSIDMEGGPLDWSMQRDMVALGWFNSNFEAADGVEMHGAVIYFDQDKGDLEALVSGGPSNVTKYYDLAIGHYDLPLTDCDGQGTSCPPSNQNLQLAHLIQTDGNQVDAFVWDLINAGDPNCSSTADPPYCFKQIAHPKLVNGEPGNQIDLIAGDFQGRGVRLGSPTVTRQTVKKPVLILAAPPMHGERLLVKDFDQNLFLTDPNGNSELLQWITNSLCDVAAVKDITPTTTCMFNFSIDGNTGNSEYASEFVETTSMSSMSSTDHHFAYSWGGSSTTSVTAQGSEGLEVNELSAYVNVSASVSVGRTNSTARDTIKGTYTDGTYTSTFVTAFDDTVVYITESENVYRYPMLGQNCTPDGGPSGCTADWTGLQYYTMSIPNQPTITKTPAKGLEWFQPPWTAGNVFTYPTNCASLAGMYGAGSNINNPLKTEVNDVGGGEGSFSQTFMSTTGNTTNTTHGHSIFNDDTVSVTAGAGCVEKPDGDGAKVSETGTFQDTRDRSTLTSDTTTTMGSTEIEATWTDSLFWMQADQFLFGSQLIVNGLTSSFQSKQIQSVSTDPAQGAKASESYITDGPLSTAYTVGFSEASEWWLDTNKTDFYTTNFDVSLALPARVENFPGTTQPGEGTEAITQCMDNGASQKLQCARMSAIDTKFDDMWGPCGDYFLMRGLFVSPPPSPPQSSMTTCMAESDCPGGEACISGSCGRCMQDSDCSAGTCTNGMCIRFVNGLPSIPGGAGDTLVDGAEAIIGVRVYNTSLTAMPSDATVKVQIYGQEWDDEDRAKGANGQPLPSFLVGGETLSLEPIAAFPSDPQEDTCDPDNAVYNWRGTFAKWDTTGLAPEVAKTYVFWVLAWAEDSSGNVLGEVPNLGLCPMGADDCPCPKVDGVPTCTWMTDVKLDTYSNNLGFYRKVITVLPQAAAAQVPLTEVRHGGVYIDGLDIEGVREVGGKLRVRARLRAQDGDTNGVSVIFFDRDPSIGEAVDEEVVSFIPKDRRRPVSISYTVTECGEKRIHVEARDGRGFVTRASRPFEVPCDDVRVDAVREVDPAEIPVEGPWTSGQLSLTFEKETEVDLTAATILLDRTFLTVWGEELVRTASDGALTGVSLTPIEASGDTGRYRVTKDGVGVRAEVVRDGERVRIDLSIEGASIRPGLFCNSDDPQLLSTRLFIDDQASPRLVVIAEDAWSCTDEGLESSEGG